MQNFDVVQGLVRVSLAGNRDAVVQQVRRLQERLKEQGHSSEAKSLSAMISRAEKSQTTTPVEFRMSSKGLPGRARITPATQLPVDRESGVPLCEIVFPDPLSAMPVLGASTRGSVEALMDEWRHRESLSNLGIEASQSLLLYGPPGTGKTSLAMFMASKLELPAVVARLDGLISSLLGSTARNLANLFDFANKYESVLILDEFDAVAKVRDDPNEVGEIKRVVNALLQNLDRRLESGLTIGITNHDSLLDTAIWRRFEHQISLGLPDFSARHTIALDLLGRLDIPLPLGRAIARLTDGLSGADVRTISFATMKSFALHGGAAPPIEMLRHGARGSSARMGANLDLLRHNDPDLARVLSSGEGGFGVQELGVVFGRDRRTITRWLQDAT